MLGAYEHHKSTTPLSIGSGWEFVGDESQVKGQLKQTRGGTSGLAVMDKSAVQTGSPLEMFPRAASRICVIQLSGVGRDVRFAKLSCGAIIGWKNPADKTRKYPALIRSSLIAINFWNQRFSRIDPVARRLQNSTCR